MSHIYKTSRVYFFIATLICLQLISLNSYSQIPTAQDCLGAIPICNQTYTTPSSTFGTGNYPNEQGPGTCLVPGEYNSMWYTFNISTSGVFAFTIFPVSSGADYDWAVYNLTNATCADIQTNGSLMVSCNSSQWGVTGISATGIGNWNGPGFTNAFNALLNVNAGETYVLNINNWSGSNGGYTVNFGASTASIFDTIKPTIDTVLPVICNDDMLTFHFSENVVCNTVEDADFLLTGPGGPYTLSAVSGPACVVGGTEESTFAINVSPAITVGGNYALHLTNNSGSVADPCGNLADTVAFPFYVSSVQASLDSVTQPTCGGSNGAIYISGTVGTPPYLFSLNGGPYLSSGAFTGLDSGVFSIVVVDSFGCHDTVQVLLQAATGAVHASVLSQSDISCFSYCDGWIAVKASGGIAPYTYTWTNSAGSTDTVKALCPNNYKVTITDSYDCFDTTSVILNEPPDLHFNVNGITDATCYGYKDGSISLSLAGGNPPYTYVWTPYGGGSNIATGLGAGTYSLMVIDVHQCDYDTTLLVDQPDPVSIIYPGDTSICFGTSAALYAQVVGGAPPYNVMWDGGASMDNPYLVNPFVKDSFVVVGFDNVGCYSAPTTYNVDVLYQPAVDLGNDTTLCLGDALFVNAYVEGASYVWQDGITDYKRFIRDRGTYWVDVYNSCFTTRDSLTLDVDDCGTCVHVPNAFTPNGDGVNDLFEPQIGCTFTSYLLKVFDRWGAMVYQTNNVNDGWNGFYESKQAEIGNYVWYIEYHGTQHSRILNEHLKGSVLLIR